MGVSVVCGVGSCLPDDPILANRFRVCKVAAPAVFARTVHAWACWRAYKVSAPQGERDTLFLERAFQKLLLNFTWWVNRKDVHGRHLFSGGFLGLDNIGLFDRSRPMPNGQYLEQGDGTGGV